MGICDEKVHCKTIVVIVYCCLINYMSELFAGVSALLAREVSHRGNMGKKERDQAIICYGQVLNDVTMRTFFILCVSVPDLYLDLVKP